MTGKVRIGFVLLLAATVFVSSRSYARADDTAASPTAAFSNMIKAGNYEDANFYLSNKFVSGDQIDTSQLFYDVVMDKYFREMRQNAAAIDKLYTYLNALKPIDLNRTMNCGNRGEKRCLFANNLLAGQERETINYFVERGLDLNQRVSGFVPTTIPLLVRLGAGYSIEDMNYFVSRGLVLGDERYPIDEMANYKDSFLYRSRLNMPGSYLELGDQNFLDALVIALGTRTDARHAQESVHRKTLCEFITYAAPSFSPSFDYLLYLLQANDEFRGMNIGKTERRGDNFYQPFPAACVALVRDMASTHGSLQQVISRFAGEGDVDTANWLIEIKKTASAN